MLQAVIKKSLMVCLPRVYEFLRRYRFEHFVLPKEFSNHLKRLSKNDIAIDIGANAGMVSAAIARRGARVIAFEPNSSAFAKLKTVVEKFPNIEAHNAAAGLTHRTIKLYLHKDTDALNGDLSQASSLLGNKPNVSEDIFEEATEIDFAAFLQSLKAPVALIKMDIEGYEIALLNHLLDTRVLDNVGRVYVETHERQFSELAAPTEALKARIKAAGYESKFFYDWH